MSVSSQYCLFDLRGNKFTMKLFRSVQLIYRRFGIYSPQPNQSPFNWKNLLVNVNISAASILSAGFFVLKANTVREYGDSFYISITSFINVLICLVQILYIGEISELIENFERFIQRSKSKNSISFKNIGLSSK